MPIRDFDSVLRSAVFDVSENGADEERLLQWMAMLRQAARSTFEPQDAVRRKLAAAYRAILDRIVRREAFTLHKGIQRFTVEQLRPRLQEELERRLGANVELIKLNRDEEIDKTLRRFAGWATSIPPGGSRTTNRRERAEEIRKSLSGLTFMERRLMIDQGQKFSSAVHSIIATDGGAIAARWVSHWHQRNYDYREDHKERMQESARLPFLIRNSWALQKGLVRLAGSKYTDEMTQPGEEPYCQCYFEFIYQLSAMPDEMITAKGREVIEAARAAA